MFNKVTTKQIQDTIIYLEGQYNEEALMIQLQYYVKKKSMIFKLDITKENLDEVALIYNNVKNADISIYIDEHWDIIYRKRKLKKNVDK